MLKQQAADASHFRTKLFAKTKLLKCNNVPPQQQKQRRTRQAKGDAASKTTKTINTIKTIKTIKTKRYDTQEPTDRNDVKEPTNVKETQGYNNKKQKLKWTHLKKDRAMDATNWRNIHASVHIHGDKAIQKIERMPSQHTSCEMEQLESIAISCFNFLEL